MARFQPANSPAEINVWPITQVNGTKRTVNYLHKSLLEKRNWCNDKIHLNIYLHVSAHVTPSSGSSVFEKSLKSFF